MRFQKNIIITGSNGRPMALDLVLPEDEGKKPLVIYVHGFNGFKDWGNFDLVAARFANSGFALLKFNFSHNGTTPGQPEDFTDLPAFGYNNYSIELEDLQRVIDWVCDPANQYAGSIDTNRIALAGHSMGGGISILQAARDERVKQLITWAGISECTTPWGSWPPERLEQWKQEGVQYYTNSRTKQQLPLYYQLYEDYCVNRERLDIEQAIKKLTIPVLICHGEVDTAVFIDKAYLLKKWQPRAELFIVESDHVFGRKHPWPGNDLPPAMESVVNASLDFLKRREQV